MKKLKVLAIGIYPDDSKYMQLEDSSKHNISDKDFNWLHRQLSSNTDTIVEVDDQGNLAEDRLMVITGIGKRANNEKFIQLDDDSQHHISNGDYQKLHKLLASDATFYVTMNSSGHLLTGKDGSIDIMRENNSYLIVSNVKDTTTTVGESYYTGRDYYSEGEKFAKFDSFNQAKSYKSEAVAQKVLDRLKSDSQDNNHLNIQKL